MAQENQVSSATATARRVEAKTSEVETHIEAAVQALREAAKIISENESGAEHKLPNFENLEGLLRIGLQTTRLIHTEWQGYANARDRFPEYH